MIKKGYGHSFSFRMVVLVMMTLGILLIFLIVNNIYAIKVVHDNTYQSMGNVLRFYMTYIDDALDASENYWVGLQDDAEISSLSYCASATDFYTTKSRINVSMSNAVQSYNCIDSLFMYISEPIECSNGETVSSQIFCANKYNISEPESGQIRRMLADYIDALPEGIPSSAWEYIEWDGNYYFVRVFKYWDIYVGGCVNISNLRKEILESDMENIAYLTYYENGGDELGNVLPAQSEKLEIYSEPSMFSYKIDNTDYLVISQPSQSGNYSLVALIREQSVIEGLYIFQRLIAVLGMFLLIFVILFIIIIRKWILNPIHKLYDAMNRVKEGDLAAHLGSSRISCREFALVNETFDTMVENIKTLRINVYEEKMKHKETQIQYQKAELQYMKLQINPHFYINCLNVIRNLSIVGQNQLVCDMTTYLGNHLRYTMEGTTVDYLYKEVDYVENYIRIQELRFPKTLKTYIEISPDSRMVKVPPLIIQTFVENTIKHQTVVGEYMEIYIVASCDVIEGKSCLLIEIWDSGDGFSETVLKKLESGEKITDENGERYGIRNVINRCHLIYHGQESIQFSNHWETGGAYIVIRLPVNADGISEEF